MTTRNLTLTSLFATLLFISSYFKLPIGMVPVTTQTFFVVIIGLTLPPLHAFFATSISALLQIIFQNVLPSVTFGFILGFILCATLISWGKQFTSTTLQLSVLVAIGSLCIYAIGVPYFVWLTNGKYTLLSALSITMTPFLIGDTIKAIASIMIAKRLTKLNR